LGFNYRMTDIQAALGISQMSRLSQFVLRRHSLAKRYRELLAVLPLTLPYQDEDTFSSFHLYPILLKLDLINKTRLDVFNELRFMGIGVNLHYIPVYRQPYYKKFGFRLSDYPNSENYYQKSISIPIFNAMSYEDQDFAVNSLAEILT